MLNIEIKTIPHKEQRYDTVGDWYEEDGIQKFRVSDLGDYRMEAMIAIHELVEQVLCKAGNIPQQVVDEFDTVYEKNRAEGRDAFDGEPGDHPQSPYQREHCYATAVERMLCAAFGINWEEYDKLVSEL